MIVDEDEDDKVELSIAAVGIETKTEFVFEVDGDEDADEVDVVERVVHGHVSTNELEFFSFFFDFFLVWRDFCSGSELSVR